VKILHVIRRNRGGVGTYVEEVSRELRKLGHEVSVISREDDLGVTSLTGSFGKLQRAVRKEDADVINAHDWSIAMPLLDVKGLVTTFHGYEGPPKIWLQKFVGGRTKLVVVSNKMGMLFPSAAVVREGVDMKKFVRKSSLRGGGKKNFRGRFLGFVQQPTGFYRFDRILEAAKIAGVKLLTAWNKIDDKAVVSLGHVPRDKMPLFYNRLAAFISIPERSGFNLCWLEAMASEVPTIGNLEGVGPELPIIHTGSHPEEIAAAIEKSMKMKNPRYRDWLRKHDFSWESTAKGLLKVYES